jgi:GT2 family glycosyltransferase/lipopolysaccharide/colanic/teichoic acid biosynthesis glycosyltransferase
MPPTVLPDLSAIIVAFDSGPALRRCLDSIRREVIAEDITSEIVVVDNGSGDATAEILAAQPDVVVLRNEYNAGFGAAVNQGFRSSTGPLVLLLNPDAELEEGSLAPLLETLRRHPDTDLAAPALILPDGSRQESPRRFYEPATILARRPPLGRTALGRKLLSEHVMSEPGGEEAGPVDWVSGAAMLLRRSGMPRHGPFDERYFLYFEDVDLCRRLQSTGRAVRFQPRSRVRHALGAGSRRQVPWNPLLWRHVHSALLYGLAWSPRWWRSRWWRGAANRLLGAGTRAAILAGTAIVLSGWAAATLAVALPWSPAAILCIALLGAVLVPSTALPTVGRGPLPSVPQTAARLSLAGASVLAVFAALSGATVSLASLTLTLAWALLSTALLALVSRARRALGVRLRRTGVGRIRSLVAGSPSACRDLAVRIGEDGGEGLALLGYVPLDPLCEGGPTPRLAPWSQVAQVAADLRAEAVLLVGSPEELARTAAEVCALRRAGVPVTYVMTGANELLQPGQGLKISGYPALQLGSGSEARALLSISRAAGRIAAGLGLLLIAPLAPVLLAASALASRSAPILAARRVGLGGRTFSMWRLRSGAGDEGCSGGGSLGRLLRWLHIDELPQLWNVVLGEMTLVGPRPIAPEVLAELEEWQNARFQVRPGITGVWQLDRLRRWRLDEMIASDLLYVLRWSPSLDAGILSETLLGRRNP